MRRLDYLLGVFVALWFGLGLVVALLASSVADIHELVRNLGWPGVAVFLAWPALMTVGVIATRR